MGDNIVPISDEQAKAIGEIAKLAQEAVKITAGLGTYLAGVAGTVPHDLVGLMGGDALRIRRATNAVTAIREAQERLRQKGVEPEEPSISIAQPIIEGVANESRVELRVLWERLLAAAMDPARANSVRRSLIEVVSKLEPEDALILPLLMGGMATQPTAREAVATRLGIDGNAVEMSFLHLIELGCLRFRNRQAEQDYEISGPVPTAIGRELCRLLEI